MSNTRISVPDAAPRLSEAFARYGSWPCTCPPGSTLGTRPRRVRLRSASAQRLAPLHRPHSAGQGRGCHPCLGPTRPRGRLL